MSAYNHVLCIFNVQYIFVYVCMHERQVWIYSCKYSYVGEEVIVGGSLVLGVGVCVYIFHGITWQTWDVSLYYGKYVGSNYTIKARFFNLCKWKG